MMLFSAVESVGDASFADFADFQSAPTNQPSL